ncbi:MAG: anthranilate synthase component I, partial [Haloplanus sp.]
MSDTSSGPTVATSRDAFRETARGAEPGTRVPVVVRLDAAPFEAYRRARGDAPAVFFETSGGQPGWGYFGVDPDVVREVSGEGVLDAITDLVAGESLARDGCEVPYPGGFFGWLSYDAVREIENLPSSSVDDRGLPRLQLARYTCLAAWRAGESALRIVATPRVGVDTVDAAYDRGIERALALAEAATAGDPSVGNPPATGPVNFTGSCDRAAYADRVRRVQEYIRDGDTFQANISHRLTAPAAVHP